MSEREPQSVEILAARNSPEMTNLVSVLVSALVAETDIGELAGLEQSSLTANPFTLPAAMAAPLPSGEKSQAVTCRSANGSLLGIWPMHVTRQWPGLRGAGLPIMRAPNETLYETCGTPMIRAGQEEAVLESVFLALRTMKDASSVLFIQSLMAEGPVWQALQVLARRGVIRLEVIEHWERSILERASAVSGENYFSSQISHGKHRNLRRKTEHLRERGNVSLSLTSAANDIPAALDRFFSLEASGWKGRRKTAVQFSNEGMAYFRSLMTNMALVKRGFVAELCLDGKPIASGLFLRCGSEITFLRTAYDEAFAAYSPGVMLDAMLTTELYQSHDFKVLDSSTDGAVDPDRIFWSQRRKMAHVVIDCKGGSITASMLVAAQRSRLWLKQQKKRLMR